SVGSDYFTFVFSSNDRIFLVSLWHKNQNILVMDKHLNFLYHLHMPENYLIQQCAFIDSINWIQTSNGVFTFDDKGKYLHHYLENISVSKLIKDQQGNFWFSSPKDGLYIVPDFTDNIYEQHPFVAKAVHLMRNELYWIDASGGIWQSDMALNKFT